MPFCEECIEDAKSAGPEAAMLIMMAALIPVPKEQCEECSEEVTH